MSQIDPVPDHWTRERAEQVWDVFAKHDMAFDRESMYYDEGADSDFCEMHRRHLVAVLNEAGLVPADALNEFRDGLTEALNAHGVPAMPSWREAIDWLAANSRTPDEEGKSNG